ncbi:hypothetical protein ANRL2_00187 [Anaerolineae bacterium]|nr:hypothetical protein ANRL2_00187 [Anaerolineae bacterium]
MSIKLRTINANKHSLFSHNCTASTTHTSPIHHHRIQTDNSLNSVRTRNFRNRFHHGDRTNCQHEINFSLFYQLSQCISNKAVPSITAIISCYYNLIADMFHIFFQDYQILISGTNDRNSIVSSLL